MGKNHTTVVPARGGMPEIRHMGLEATSFADAYHQLLRASWHGFFGFLLAMFAAFNGLFAVLYVAGGDCINAPHPGNLLEAFSFSVQTMSGIGYGAMNPTTPYAHVLVVIQAFLSMVGMAAATGLLFAKFSRPTTRIGFTDKLVIHEYQGLPHLFVRMVNQRTNQMVDASLYVSVLLEETSDEGIFMRRIHKLPLVREHNPLFSLTWTAMHPINEDSPLHGMSEAEIRDRAVAVFVTLIGLDDTFNQTVHAQAVFRASDLVFGARFGDMMIADGLTSLTIDHSKLHVVEPLSSRSPTPGDQDS